MKCTSTLIVNDICHSIVSSWILFLLYIVHNSISINGLNVCWIDVLLISHFTTDLLVMNMDDSSGSGFGNTYVNVQTRIFHTQQYDDFSRINVIKTLHDFAATWFWFCVFSFYAVGNKFPASYGQLNMMFHRFAAQV